MVHLHVSALHNLIISMDTMNWNMDFYELLFIYTFEIIYFLFIHYINIYFYIY